MSRQILCQSCGDKWSPHPRDAKEGWEYLSTWLSFKVPNLYLTQAVCDSCGAEIADGDCALAVSMWKEVPIRVWEDQYGTMIPERAAKMHTALTKDKTP